jgi:hypothetical protein
MAGAAMVARSTAVERARFIMGEILPDVVIALAGLRI